MPQKTKKDKLKAKDRRVSQHQTKQTERKQKTPSPSYEEKNEVKQIVVMPESNHKNSKKDVKEPKTTRDKETEKAFRTFFIQDLRKTLIVACCIVAIQIGIFVLKTQGLLPF